MLRMQIVNHAYTTAGRIPEFRGVINVWLIVGIPESCRNSLEKRN